MDIDAIFEAVADDIKVLAKNAAKTFANEAEEDLNAFLKDAQDDLKRYSLLIKQGEISKPEFKFLVKMKADSAEMLAVSAKGIARARFKHLLESVRDLIVKSVLAAI